MRSGDASILKLGQDDAHWLDRPTLGALAFVARRLDSEPLDMVAAVRAGPATALDDARLPTLDVERLRAPAAAELLDRRAPELHPVLRARVLAEAAGNPLALVELARTAPASPTRLSASGARPRAITVAGPALERAAALTVDLR